MASPFDAIDAVAQGVITERLGEAITFVGMLSGDFTQTPDPEKPEQTVLAVIALSPRTGEISDGLIGRSSSGSHRTHTRSELWVEKARFEGLSWRPARDDLAIINPGTTGEQRYPITAVLPMDQGDVQILLGEGVI